LDTRASRLLAPGAAHVFELDLVENAAYKEQRPRRIYRGLPENVALVPVDSKQTN